MDLIFLEQMLVAQLLGCYRLLMMQQKLSETLLPFLSYVYFFCFLNSYLILFEVYLHPQADSVLCLLDSELGLSQLRQLLLFLYYLALLLECWISLFYFFSCNHSHWFTVILELHLCPLSHRLVKFGACYRPVNDPGASVLRRQDSLDDLIK